MTLTMLPAWAKTLSVPKDYKYLRKAWMFQRCIITVFRMELWKTDSAVDTANL